MAEIDGKTWNVINGYGSENIIYWLQRGEINEEIIKELSVQNDNLRKRGERCEDYTKALSNRLKISENAVDTLIEDKLKLELLIKGQESSLNKLDGVVIQLKEDKEAFRKKKNRRGLFNWVLVGASVYLGGKVLNIF